MTRFGVVVVFVVGTGVVVLFVVGAGVVVLVVGTGVGGGCVGMTISVSVGQKVKLYHMIYADTN